VIAHLRQHDISPREIRVYNLRHTWACNYLDGRGDIFGCAMMMGNSVKQLQARYYHVDEQKIHERYLRFMAANDSRPVAKDEPVTKAQRVA